MKSSLPVGSWLAYNRKTGKTLFCSLLFVSIQSIKTFQNISNTWEIDPTVTEQCTICIWNDWLKSKKCQKHPKTLNSHLISSNHPPDPQRAPTLRLSPSQICNEDAAVAGGFGSSIAANSSCEVHVKACQGTSSGWSSGWSGTSNGNGIRNESACCDMLWHAVTFSGNWNNCISHKVSTGVTTTRCHNHNNHTAVRGHMIISGRQSHTQGAVAVKAQAVAALRGRWKRLPTLQHLNQH